MLRAALPELAHEGALRRTGDRLNEGAAEGDLVAGDGAAVVAGSSPLELKLSLDQVPAQAARLGRRRDVLQQREVAGDSV